MLKRSLLSGNNGGAKSLSSLFSIQRHLCNAIHGNTEWFGLRLLSQLVEGGLSKMWLVSSCLECTELRLLTCVQDFMVNNAKYYMCLCTTHTHTHNTHTHTYAHTHTHTRTHMHTHTHTHTHAHTHSHTHTYSSLP